MNTGEKTTVATLAVFFGLIFLLIITTICCVLRRGCKQQSNSGEYRRRRALGTSDFEKSGTITSSDTRVTDNFPSDGLRAKPLPAGTIKSTQLKTGFLVNISEEDVNSEKETQSKPNNMSEISGEQLNITSKEQVESANDKDAAITIKTTEYPAEVRIEILPNSPGRQSRLRNSETRSKR